MGGGGEVGAWVDWRMDGRVQGTVRLVGLAGHGWASQQGVLGNTRPRGWVGQRKVGLGLGGQVGVCAVGGRTKLKRFTALAGIPVLSIALVTLSHSQWETRLRESRRRGGGGARCGPATRRGLTAGYGLK